MRSSYVSKLRYNYVSSWFVNLLCPYFFMHSSYLSKLRYNYIAFWFANLLYLFLRQTYLQWDIFHDVRITIFCFTFALRMGITLQLHFGFARLCDVFLLHNNYVIYLYNVVTYFCNVRIRLYFGTLELPTEITLWNGHFLVKFVCNQKITKKHVIIRYFFRWEVTLVTRWNEVTLIIMTLFWMLFVFLRP